MNDKQTTAPGAPGITPRWTSSAHTGVGTALSDQSRVWFALSHGIFNEMYFPSIDQACTRDMGMIVTDGQGFFSEEKRHTNQEVRWVEDGVPAFVLTNVCNQGRYRIEKTIAADPKRCTILQKTRFKVLKGKADDYHLFALLAPHLGNRGRGNSAWIRNNEHSPLLLAQREQFCLALACSSPWIQCSVGYAGTSDGWQDLQKHHRMTWNYDRAENGNVAMMGEVDVAGSEGDFVIAVGFGKDPEQASEAATTSLNEGFEEALSDYISGWKQWHGQLQPLKSNGMSKRDLGKISAAVMRTHQAKSEPGAIIASLAIPWGFAKGDDDLGGYHLVWPRDLVEVGQALLALGAHDDVRHILDYLKRKQEDDGHWSQNMWVDGEPYWTGVQLDETAFPILLVDIAQQADVLNQSETKEYWPMVRKAARYLVNFGPVTDQDRWEEDPGYSPLTISAAVAALLAAVNMAKHNGEKTLASYLQDTADYWNDSLEKWTYATNTKWCEQFGVDGYYVRIAPQETADAASPTKGFVPIKNRPVSDQTRPASQIVSADALGLVLFGLRAPDDPRIVNTVKVIDGLTKVDTLTGPCWHRYNNDGYGEHEDGSPFDGSGVGRAWPLLTGERAHYELACGHKEEATRLLRAMESFANPEGFIPEQIWDTDDISGKNLFRGKPSGSAMPLTWAHAEYIKLRRSLESGKVFDMPRRTVERYVENETRSRLAVWRFNNKCHDMQRGKILRVETRAPAIVHWSADEWNHTQDTRTKDSGMGLYFADLDTKGLAAGTKILFTFNWPEADKWEGANYAVKVKEPA